MSYKVMLVDDDFPVLEFITTITPWKELNLLLQATCESPIVALEIARKEMPDLIITDIGMPEMNGFQLIKELQSINPKLPIAILSCHNEFSFAQQAVKLNVTDYILKESMGKTEIIHLLKTMRHKVEQLRQQEQERKFFIKISKKKKVTQRKEAIKNLFNSPIIDTQSWTQEVISVINHILNTHYRPVWLSIDRFHTVIKRYQSKESLMFAIENLLDEILQDEDKVYYYSLSANEYVFLFPYPCHPTKSSSDTMHTFFQKIQYYLRRYLKISATCMTGDIGKSPYELRQSVQHLMTKRDLRFYEADESIYSDQQNGFSTNDLFDHYPEAIKDFHKLVTEENKDQISSVLNDWVAFINEKRYEPSMVKEWFLKIMLDIQVKFKSLLFLHKTFEAERIHKTLLLNIHTLHDLANKSENILHNAINVMGQIYMLPQREEIRESIQFMIKNPHKKITLLEMAERLHLNPSHFSRLFKRETGYNFTEYVINMKMELAMQLLMNTDKSTDEVSLSLGYDNKNYFQRLFKKRTGITPAQYQGIERRMD